MNKLTTFFLVGKDRISMLYFKNRRFESDLFRSSISCKGKEIGEVELKIKWTGICGYDRYYQCNE